MNWGIMISYLICLSNHANMFQANDDQQEATTRRRVEGVKVFSATRKLLSNKLKSKKYCRKEKLQLKKYCSEEK